MTESPLTDSKVAVPRKRLFIGLLSAISGVVLLITFLLWWVPSIGLVNIHPVLPIMSGAILALLAFVIVGGLGMLVLTLLTGRDLFLSQRLRRLVIRYLLPGVISIGRLVGVDKDTLQQSFIALNNQLVRAKKLQVTPDKALILLPHCIQLFDCDIKLTGDVNRCIHCGKCDISDLAEAAKKRGIDIAVATGGTLARKLIVERQPEFILAVACERDLTAGIRDSYPLPVIGVLNQRPNGPCFNTNIIMGEVEKVLDEYILPTT